MQILRPSQRRPAVVNLVMKRHTRKAFRGTRLVATVISSSAATTISTANRWRPTAVLTLCASLWNRCWRRSNGVRRWGRDFKKTLLMTDEDSIMPHCHICDKRYVNGDISDRDHCHITGKYRRSAHKDCNLSFRQTNRIPVIFHNLKGYDSHFIMQEIGKFKQAINVIPNNM